MKSIIERIRAAKTWQERAAIAANEHPETQFNSFFERAEGADRAMQLGKIKNAEHDYMILGAAIAKTIKKREPQTLHDMAVALAKWKRHEQTAKPDYLLMTLCSMAGMFPPGWEKTWGMVQGRRVPGFSKPPRDKSVNLRTSDIIENLRRIDPDFDDDKLNTYRKRIQRYTRQLPIALDGSPFKRTAMVRHNHRKKTG